MLSASNNSTLTGFVLDLAAKSITFSVLEASGLLDRIPDRTMGQEAVKFGALFSATNELVNMGLYGTPTFIQQSLASGSMVPIYRYCDDWGYNSALSYGMFRTGAGEKFSELIKPIISDEKLNHGVSNGLIIVGANIGRDTIDASQTLAPLSYITHPVQNILGVGIR